MDPSYINTKTAAHSIVKEAPLALCERDNRPARPKNKTELGTSSKTSQKRDKNVTKRPHHERSDVGLSYLSPPFGGAAQAGGDNNEC